MILLKLKTNNQIGIKADLIKVQDFIEKACNLSEITSDKKQQIYQMLQMYSDKKGLTLEEINSCQ